MLRNWSLFILPHLFSLILLSQSRCVDSGCFYNIKSLQKISSKLLKCKEDSIIFSDVSKQLLIKDSTINFKDVQIKGLDKQVNLYETVVIGKNTEIANINAQLKKAGRKLKTTQALWGGSSLLLCVGLGYFLLH